MSYHSIFDSHAHYDDEAFKLDRDETLSSLKEHGVCAAINCGCNLKSSLSSVQLAEKYPFVFAAVGVHPNDAEGVTDSDLEKIAELYKRDKVVAVGEIGLDYHYDFIPRQTQLELFERQLKLAVQLDLPVIVHDREAHADTLNLLEKYLPKGVVHCFSGSAQSALEVVKMGMYIGLGGAVTFKNARKPLEVAAAVPVDRILLETDCPYMAPVPYRGKRCNSAMIERTAQVIAAVRGEDTQELINICCKNATELFSVEI